MGTKINYRKRVPISVSEKKYCERCQKEYDVNENFCSECGSKLKSKENKVYANIGKNGVTSISYKKDGVTFNSNGNVTIPMAKGISITTNSNKGNK